MKTNSTLLSARPPTGTTSVTTRSVKALILQDFKRSTDRHPKHHLTPMRTPLLSHLNRTLGPATYEIKTYNCNITKPSTVASQASFPNERSLPAQMVFFLRKMASFIILRSMSLFGVAQQLKATYILLLYCFLS